MTHRKSDSEAGSVIAQSRKATRSKVVSLVLLILAMVIMIYPVVSTLANDYNTQRFAKGYDDLVDGIEPDEVISELLAEAQDYNSRLDIQGHLPRPEDPKDAYYQDYLEQLNPFGAESSGGEARSKGVMARVTIPTINVDLPVYHGTEDDVLYRGAGHMYGSDLPVGAAEGFNHDSPGRTAVITAHTGMVNASMFDNLDNVVAGDYVYVTVLDQKLRYRVVGEETVKPEDWEAITYEAGIDKLVLLTCTPYGINSDRLLVTAIRDDGDGQVGQEELRSSWLQLSWWMKLDLALIALILGVAVWSSVRSRLRNKALTK